MNKLDIQLNGHEFLNEDLMFIQTAFHEALTGIASSLGGNCILSGCSLSIDGPGPGWKLDEGYVALAGEVFKVDNKTFPGALSNPVWVLVETPADFNPILYADGLEKDVHFIRRVTVEEFASQPFISSYPSTIINYNQGINQIELINNWIVGALPVSNPFFVKEGRWVSLLGDITFGEGSIPIVNLPFCQLPNGYRPLQNGFYAACMGSSFGDNYLAGAETTWIRVDTDGNCYADPNATYGKSINLNNVRFMIA